MTQISRPFVIALAAVLLFAGVWFVALKPHSSSSSEAPATTSTPAPAPSGVAQEKANAAPSHVDHTSTPGLEGLTKDINKAHGAVATSQGSSKHVLEKAAQASTGAPPASTSTSPTGTAGSTATKHAATPTTSTTPASVHSAAATAAAKQAEAAQAKAASEAAASAGKETPTGIPTRQALVETALKEGKIAVLLFWNPHGSEDQVVHLSVGLIAGVHEIFESLSSNPKASGQLKQSGASLSKIAVFEAPPSQVASFGSFTRTVQVLQTPTILIVNPLGRIASIPGYTETRAINQRIDESRKEVEAAAKQASQHAAK